MSMQWIHSHEKYLKTFIDRLEVSINQQYEDLKDYKNDLVLLREPFAFYSDLLSGRMDLKQVKQHLQQQL